MLASLLLRISFHGRGRWTFWNHASKVNDRRHTQNTLGKLSNLLFIVWTPPPKISFFFFHLKPSPTLQQSLLLQGEALKTIYCSAINYILLYLHVAFFLFWVGHRYFLYPGWAAISAAHSAPLGRTPNGFLTQFL